MIGTTLAHFKITGKLGEGGMGEVYLAEDTKLGREVAIKVLPEMVAADEERLARFEREAKLLASLNHPNIGAIYSLETAEAGTEAGHYDSKADPESGETIEKAGLRAGRSGTVRFLVLELIEGDTLAEALANGPLSVEKALQIGQQIALALEAAHAKGVIHRDLKPANVKLTPEGKAKVLDFGLAKAWDVDESSGSSPLISRSPTLTQGMTEVGVLLGTAAYMSPEQARGKPVDKRADIWAFGCVMLEMLSGRKVFGGDTVTDMIAAVVATEPDWERLPSDTPKALSRLLRRCLEKDQEQRLRDIGDARLELEEMLAKSPEELREPDVATVPSKANRIWQLAAVALAVTAAGLSFALWQAGQEAPPQVTRAFIPAPPAGDFDLVTDFPAPLALSPDGRTLVYGIQEEGANKRLWIRDLDDIEARPLNGTEGALYPFWSPDSRYVAFFSQGKLKKIEVSGGPAMTLCDAANGKGGTWNRDGVIVFAPTHSAMIRRVSSAGGESVAITQLDPEKGEDSHRHPRFLPDGEHFLYASRSGFGGQGSNSRIMIGSLSGGSQEVMLTSSNAEYAAGHWIYVSESTLMARPFDAKRRELTGDAFPLAENVYGDMGALLGAFTTSQTGVLAYQTGTLRESVDLKMQWRDREGNVLSQVGEPAPYNEISLSPDQTTALINLSDAASGNRDLWLFDMERELRTRFTFDPAQDWVGVWSADGSRIAFSSERNGSSDLFVKAVTGGGEAELLFDDDNLKYPLSWSSDGRYLLFESWGGTGGAQIFALDLENPAQPLSIQASKFTARWPALSPDDRWLAYISSESGRDEVYVTAFPEGGRKWQVSESDAISEARWNGNQELVLLTQSGVLQAAEVDGAGDTFRVGRVRDLFAAQVPTSGYGFDFSNDGQRLLVAVAEEEEGSNPRMDPLTLVLNWTADLDRD